MKYACTYITKDVEVDNYETGCDPDSRQTIFADRVDLTADSLPELLKDIGMVYGLEIDSLFVPEYPCDYVGFNRQENVEGEPPSQTELQAFVAGQIDLWLADYTFNVEKREVSPLSKNDFKGVETHE